MNLFELLGFGIAVVGLLGAYFGKNETVESIFKLFGFLSVSTKSKSIAIVIIGGICAGYGFIVDSNKENIYYVQGIISDENGKPLKDVRVYIKYYPKFALRSDTDTTNSKGFFSFSVRSKREVSGTIKFSLNNLHDHDLVMLNSEPHTYIHLTLDTIKRVVLTVEKEGSTELLISSNLTLNINNLIAKKLRPFITSINIKDIHLNFHYSKANLHFHLNGKFAEYYAGGTISVSINNCGPFEIGGSAIPEIQTYQTEAVMSGLNMEMEKIVKEHIDTVCNKIKQCLQKSS